VEVDRNGLEVLDADECVRLLGTRSIGRIGITSEALPTILPVDYVVADGQVLFRTGAGTKLEAATHHAVVAFEVDDVDEATGTGWSVVVTGVAEAHPGDVADATDLGRLRRWVAGRDGHVVAIPLDRVTGRRLDRPGSG
jgi:uncharacterized protein